MEGLTAQDWSLIARYLKEEASHNDLVQLDNLLTEHPNLKHELSKISDQVNGPATFSEADFDAEKAFKKLHQRFKKENLM